MQTDRDRLIELIEKTFAEQNEKRGLLTAPHTADHLLANGVVKVVRCKDCAVPHNKWTGCPNLNGLIPPPDFYCSRGELKECEGV